MFKQFLVKLLLVSLVMPVSLIRADFKQDAQENLAYITEKILKNTKKGCSAAWYAARVAAGTAGVAIGSAGTTLGCIRLAIIHNEALRVQISKEMYALEFARDANPFEDLAKLPIWSTAVNAALIACASTLGYVSYKYVLPTSDKNESSGLCCVVVAPVDTVASCDN